MNDFLPEKDRKNDDPTLNKATMDKSKAMRFVLVQRNKEDKYADWEVTSEELINDCINDVITYLNDCDKDTLKAYAWVYAKKGIVGLKPTSRGPSRSSGKLSETGCLMRRKTTTMTKRKPDHPTQHALRWSLRHIY